MTDYKQEVAKLAPLEAFDVNAFLGTSEVPQSVCDLALSLALAYNDLRDLIFTRLLLSNVRPSGTEISPELGQYHGFVIAVIRLQVGRVHELLKLIAKSRDEIDHPVFRQLVSRLSKPGRDAWSSLSVAAGETVPSDKSNESSLVRALRFVRHKVSFHYDTENIRYGYERAFSDSESTREPLLSRGSSLKQNRFYFADAAVEEFIRGKDTDPTVAEFLQGGGELLDNINQALYEIVTKFIALRGFGWRQPHNTAAPADQKAPLSGR